MKQVVILSERKPIVLNMFGRTNLDECVTSTRAGWTKAKGISRIAALARNDSGWLREKQVYAVDPSRAEAQFSIGALLA